MSNVRSDIVIMLKEKGIERGYRCGQIPGGNYFEKKNGKWVDLEVNTIPEVFKKKGLKIPAVPVKAAKSVAKKVAGEKPVKKVVKKNAKPKAAKVSKPQTEQPRQPEAGEQPTE
jgi:hypothetical protein